METTDSETTSYPSPLTVEGESVERGTSPNCDSQMTDSGLESIAENDCPVLGGNEVTQEFVFAMIDMFREGKNRMLSESDVVSILNRGLTIFKNEPTLVNVELGETEKLTICGDIHGQFFDLLNIFEMNNYPKAHNPYLFNGDIVDRGAFSVECVLTLLCFKILHPDKFFIARGNHECDEVNELYGLDCAVKNTIKEKWTKYEYISYFSKVSLVVPSYLNLKLASGKLQFIVDNLRK